ncbi:(2Fe-2S)-binding [Micractinium conductrix]|uniref:(2Fe-2S)-binding n=1 Tax=Micractinium conductrix TaxID=554055 RepID=A0A2P6V3D5_9CHLO|nr:(2Fe-2S)-binding [Micractinium conductrix]|eukprot:PSC68584.1 (2Fe-2S)-binding [Micractinium conductrix]
MSEDPSALKVGDLMKGSKAATVCNIEESGNKDELTSPRRAGMHGGSDDEEDGDVPGEDMEGLRNEDLAAATQDGVRPEGSGGAGEDAAGEGAEEAAVQARRSMRSRRPPVLRAQSSPQPGRRGNRRGEGRIGAAAGEGAEEAQEAAVQHDVGLEGSSGAGEDAAGEGAEEAQEAAVQARRPAALLLRAQAAPAPGERHTAASAAAPAAPPAAAQAPPPAEATFATADETVQIKPKTAADGSRFVWTRNWYPLTALDYLDPSRPAQLKVLGYDLVVWRDGSGTWRAFRDACPHRAAPLSEGRINPATKNLECAYVFHWQPWLRHLYKHTVAAQDIAVLHRQGTNMASPEWPGWRKGFYLPTSRDAGVVVLRKWLDTVAGGGIAWGPNIRPGGAPIQAETRRELLFDHYHQHTAVQPAQRWPLEPPSSCCARRGAAAPLSPASLALLCVLGAALAARSALEKLEQQFIFSDWRHADH